MNLSTADAARTAGAQTLLAMALVAVVLAGRALAQVRSAAELQLDRALEQRLTLTWQDQQFGVALRRLSESSGAPTWLDRRVDPARPVTLDAADRTLEDVLQQIAAAVDCGISPYHGVVYVGPKQAAIELLTLSAIARDSLSKAAPPVRSRWLSPQPWSIARLSEPRQLLTKLAASADAVVLGGELVPHDLWPARDLPALAALDRVVLLLAGFDLTCELSLDGQRLRIKPIERPVQISRQYLIPAEKHAAVDRLLIAFKDANVQWQRQRLTVAARVEEHQRITATLRGGTAATTALPPRSLNRKPAAPSGQRFSLEIKNQPVGPVLDQLAAQLKLTVEWDPALAADPQKGREALVSCNVQQVQLDELLQALLSPVGLKAERVGDRVAVREIP